MDNTMGVGSTCLACQNVHRKFIGIELDEKYYNIAVERLQENENDMNDNQIFIGEKLFDSDVDYLPKMILEATDTDVTNKIRDTLGLQDEKLIIATGTRAC